MAEADVVGMHVVQRIAGRVGSLGIRDSRYHNRIDAQAANSFRGVACSARIPERGRNRGAFFARRLSKAGLCVQGGVLGIRGSGGGEVGSVEYNGEGKSGRAHTAAISGRVTRTRGWLRSLLESALQH